MSRHRTFPGRVRWLVAAALMVLPSCRAPEPQPSKMQVQLVTSAALSGRWERAAERGLGRIAVEFDAQIGRQRAEDGDTRRLVLAELGRIGTDLVFCVGAGFEPVLYAEVAGYPEAHYVLLPGSVYRDNVASIRLLTDGVGYLGGAVAAALADDGHAGILRGPGGPWLEELETGFADGVATRNGADGFSTAEGADGAWRLREQGVTIALYATDVADERVLAAAHDAGLTLISADPAAMGRLPDTVVAAIDIDVAEAMVRVAREVADGAFTGRVYAFDVGSGVMDVVLSPNLPPDRAEAARSALDTARSEVTAGYVEIENLGM
jgi:basic membrane lipoprotein Med (substrate-binding protein (PBP1-ABC) superfamily)